MMCWLLKKTCVKSLSAIHGAFGSASGPDDVHLNFVGSAQVIPLLPPTPLPPALPAPPEPGGAEPPLPAVAPPVPGAPLVGVAPPLSLPPLAGNPPVDTPPED